MSSMYCEDIAETKRTFRCNYQPYDNLNVVYNSSTSMLIFWNKYQLFLYEDLNFEDATRIFTPEFLVHQIIISNNYLVCLDCKGNIHVTSLKFKNCAQKRLKPNFQPREENVLAFVQRGQHVLSLKLVRETYFLCLNEIITEFPKVQQIKIKYNDDIWPLPATTQEKCLITACKISENNDNMKQLFEVPSTKDHDIVIVTFDRMNVYAFLLMPNMPQEELKLIKLYSSPLEICTIQILELDILTVLIVLYSGTVISLHLVKPAVPVIIHLNTAVNKFLASKDCFIYTDGMSMWKTEDSFNSAKFSQYFVRQVKDFAKCGDQLICSTYSNLFYLLSVDDESIYLETPYSEFYPVEKLSNNAEYLFKIFDENKKNEEIVKKVHEEGTYITAFSLSNRPDLMNTVLRHEVVVYEHYEDVINENPGVKLVEDLKEYFKIGSANILIKLTTTQLEHVVDDMMKQLFNTSMLHISLYADDRLIKTNSMSAPESLKNINVLLPLDIAILNVACVKVDTKMIFCIPGASVSEAAWTTFYHKEVTLNPEHFVKTDLISSRNINLKDPQEPLEELILKLAINENGSLFKFSSIKGSSSAISLYVKLPANYREILQNRELYTSRFEPKRALYWLTQLSSQEFLECRSNLTFEAGKYKVNVEIASEEIQPVSNALLWVSCEDGETALRMRNFLAELIYANFESHDASMKFVDYALYTATENISKAVRTAGLAVDMRELHSLTHQYQRNIMGSLPI